jgi:hypothetical protein
MACYVITLADELEKSGTLHGGVMCGELKFKASFYSNFKDGMTVAMAALSGMKDLSLAKELEHLVEWENQFDKDEKEAQENYADDTHVNSFQLKTASDFSHNGEYFYNDGSLTSHKKYWHTKKLRTFSREFEEQQTGQKCRACAPHTQKAWWFC